jgi:hypothetical protein
MYSFTSSRSTSLSSVKFKIARDTFGVGTRTEYTNSTEVVSSDFIGSRTAGVYDAQATITSGNRLTMYSFTSSRSTSLSSVKFKIARDTFGVGTRTELPAIKQIVVAVLLL